VKPLTRSSLILVLVLGAPFFFIGGPDYHDSRSFKCLWDLGHILFFTLASFGLCDFFSMGEKEFSPGAIFWRIFSLVFCLGLSVELIQGFLSGRSPSGFDLLRNQFGSILGCMLFASWKNMLPIHYKRIMYAGTMPVLLLFLWPLSRAVIDEQEAAHQFPVLSDFETRFEFRRWQHVDQLTTVDNPVRHGSRAMRVQLSTQKYSGTGLFYFPRDWSGYEWLHFSVFRQDDEEMSLYARIHDVFHKKHGRAYSDRYHTRFNLKKGWNDCKISLRDVRYAPADREMDMHKIESFAIFVVSQKHPRIIFLDHVYLSN